MCDKKQNSFAAFAVHSPKAISKGAFLPPVGVLLVLASFVFPTRTLAQDSIKAVASWRGHYEASATTKMDNLPGSKLNESRKISARLVLDKMTIDEELVTWAGTAYCDSSINRHEIAMVIPDTPMRTDIHVEDSRAYKTPAMLQVDVEDGQYYIELCNESFEMESQVTAVVPNETGGFSTIQETDSFEDNPMAVSWANLTPEGTVPERGVAISGSRTLPGHAAEGDDAMSMQIGAALRSAFQKTNMDVSGIVQWELSPDRCSSGGQYSVSIWYAKEIDELVFRDGKLKVKRGNPGPFKPDAINFEATPSNGDYQDIRWTPPEIPDSRREQERFEKPAEDISGIALNYTGTPQSNEGFGEYKIQATLDSAEQCTEPGKKTMRVFFERDGKDSPADEPNWYYYWFHTSAGQGLYEHASFDRTCQKDTLGYYNAWVDPDRIYICEGAQIKVVNEDWGVNYEGIDGFASTVKHEWQHKLDRDGWWGEFDRKYRPHSKWDYQAPEWNEYDRKRREADSDSDHIPNWADDNPQDSDADDDGYKDVESSAYAAGKRWKRGSADKEDWACPGKQCED